MINHSAKDTVQQNSAEGVGGDREVGLGGGVGWTEFEKNGGYKEVFIK